jgi:uncharacterized membrane protein YphA (DoxX/SURF4 family)
LRQNWPIDVLCRQHDSALSPWFALAVELLLSAMVLTGLLTAVAAALVSALACLWAILVFPAVELPLLVAGMGSSLALSGPGAWSVDARLFGLKRIEIDGYRSQ